MCFQSPLGNHHSHNRTENTGNEIERPDTVELPNRDKDGQKHQGENESAQQGDGQGMPRLFQGGQVASQRHLHPTHEIAERIKPHGAQTHVM